MLAREGVVLTSSTVHRILLRYGLVREQDRHSHATGRFERERPNELWQMDFKGPKHWHGKTGPLSVIDDHSRYAVALEPMPSTHGELVKEHLQHPFTLSGLPDDAAEQVAWLKEFRWEYNHVRPHEALGMKTPASRWTRSEKKYDPRQPVWEYAEGARTLKIDCQGTCDLEGQRWRVGKALAGERVRIERVDDRFLIFYCTTLIREVDLVTQRSTMV